MFWKFCFLSSIILLVVFVRDGSSESFHHHNATKNILLEPDQHNSIFHSFTALDGSIVTTSEKIEKIMARNKKTSSRSENTIVDINERLKVKGLVEGDILLPSLRNSNPYIRKWKKTRHGKNKGLVLIPYKFENSFGSKYRKYVERSLPWFTNNTCIRFVQKSRNGPHIKIKDGSGCYAIVGMRNSYRGQPVSLNIPGCLSTGTILHELMHAIGFEHEQSRNDRDKYVQIILDHVSRDKYHNFRKQRLNNLVVYDYGSAMHYSRRSFAKESFYRSIEVLSDHVPKPTIGQKLRLSPYDIEEIKYMYNCEPGTYKRCGKDFNNKRSGSFQSPNYPSSYPKESHCTWQITSRPGRYVKVTFKKISIRYSTYCQNDAILVHDGINAGAPVLRRICGRPSDTEVTSSGRNIFIIFSSDTYKDFNTGFTATFTESKRKGKSPVLKSVSNTKTLQPTTQTATSLQCNFDSGMCGMYQEKLDEIDWVRRRGRTRLSRYTGPSVDHTTKKGYYLMVNAGDLRLDNGDEGTIRTPWFGYRRTFYIKFNYHMLGRRMGALDLYAYELKYDKSSREVRLFQKTRNQKNKWHKAEVAFKPQRNTQFVHFYWKAFRDSWTSNMALDDISITASGDNLAGAKLCTFDKNTSPKKVSQSSIPDHSSRDLGEYKYPDAVVNSLLCGWKQISQDQFDWTRNKGQTKTKRTGPRADHTNSKGYFMYIESSQPRKSKDVAILESYSMFPITYCIDMYYHMWGASIGELSISSIQYNGGSTPLRTTLHRIKGRQKGVWHNLMVDYVPRNKPEEVVFRIEGVVGRGELGDISIDDVAVLPGKCDVCKKPSHRFKDVSKQELKFVTGCVNAKLFWVRCCTTGKSKAIYRRVDQCNPNMFSSKRLNWYCTNL